MSKYPSKKVHIQNFWQLVILLVILGSSSVVHCELHKSTLEAREKLLQSSKHPIVQEYEYAEDGIYNADFWDGFDGDENYYEHDFVHIPDFIDKPEVNKWFNMTHHFLWGIEKGIYNDTVTLNPQCFGPFYVNRVNQLAAMFKDDVWGNIILEISAIYQLFYMLTQDCHIDNTINDVLLFCWNTGCFDAEKLWVNFYMHIFYMTRSLNDIVIVIFEACFDEEILNDPKMLNQISMQSGETIAQIVQEFFQFEKQDNFYKHPAINHGFKLEEEVLEGEALEEAKIEAATKAKEQMETTMQNMKDDTDESEDQLDENRKTEEEDKA